MEFNWNNKITRFEWDINKSITNYEKHGISFEEACQVFYDDDSIILSDTEHSENEDRFLIIGLSYNVKLLVVCHCYRDGDIVRIISARKATKTERQLYLSE